MNDTSDFWTSIPDPGGLDSEANVRHRFVFPLLLALGYRSEDIESEFPVVFQQGRRGRPPAADFICFDGTRHDKSTSLLVVEVKAYGKPLLPAKKQGESYAQNLGAPLLLVTNGINLELWQMQILRESTRVLQVPISQLASHRGSVERLLNKTAVRDYCVTLKSKTIVEATSDFGTYESAMLNLLITDVPSIGRTLKPRQVVGNRIELPSTNLLEDYPRGAIVIGHSGYGKTTLSRSIFKQAIEKRQRGDHNAVTIEVKLPYLETCGENFLSFLHHRVAAHQPGIMIDSFRDSLRKIGATIICDSLDRTSYDFQRRIATEIPLFLQDHPLSQVFIFSRADAIREIQYLPILELLPLSDLQARELEEIVLPTGNIWHYSIVGSMPQTLQSLSSNPLLLLLILRYWQDKNAFPKNITNIFQSWLETVLETEPNDLVSRSRRESALSIIAEATTNGPLTGIKAAGLLKDKGIPESVLNELIQCNAIWETDSVLEIQHDGLADYLRAKIFVEMSVRDQIKKFHICRRRRIRSFQFCLCHYSRTRRRRIFFGSDWYPAASAHIWMRCAIATTARMILSDSTQKNHHQPI